MFIYNILMIIHIYIYFVVIGKTTLMNTLSGRNCQHLQITGDVYINNYLSKPLERRDSSFIGYVEQHERFLQTITLEEHLIFQVEIYSKIKLYVIFVLSFSRQCFEWIILSQMINVICVLRKF